MSRIDSTRPDISQTLGDVISTSRSNFSNAAADIDDINAMLSAHIGNSADAHGVADIQSAVDDYDLHKTDIDAHGLGLVRADLVAAYGEVQAARGSTADLNTRLSVAMLADGTPKVSSQQTRWIDPGYVPTFVSDTVFTLSGDRTKVFLSGTIVRLTSIDGQVYGLVLSCAYDGGADRSTVTLESKYPVVAANQTKVELALYCFSSQIETAIANNTAAITTMQMKLTSAGFNNIVNVSGDHVVGLGDRTIFVDTTSGLAMVEIPSAADSAGRWIAIKIVTGNRGCMIFPVDGGTIEGESAAHLIGTGDSVHLMSDGTAWYSIFKTSGTINYNGDARLDALCFG